MLEFTLFLFCSVNVVASQAITLYNNIDYKNQSRPQPLFVGSYDRDSTKKSLC